MKQELTVRQRSALNTKLDRLAQAALRAHERAKQCAATLVQNMARSGEALCKARDLCDNAAWEDFLLNKFKVSKTTAYRYMYIAKHWARLQANRAARSAHLAPQSDPITRFVAVGRGCGRRFEAAT